MQLDREIDRDILLEMINASSFSGRIVEDLLRLKIAVQTAPSTEYTSKFDDLCSEVAKHNSKVKEG